MCDYANDCSNWRPLCIEVTYERPNEPRCFDKISLKANKEPVAEVPCSAGLSDALDTGDLVNDPLYKALDKLYERGWVDKHKGRDYDPRGTEEWQGVLDLFRLQKGR